MIPDRPGLDPRGQVEARRRHEVVRIGLGPRPKRNETRVDKQEGRELVLESIAVNRHIKGGWVRGLDLGENPAVQQTTPSIL